MPPRLRGERSTDTREHKPAYSEHVACVLGCQSIARPGPWPGRHRPRSGDRQRTSVASVAPCLWVEARSVLSVPSKTCGTIRGFSSPDGLGPDRARRERDPAL